MRKEWSDEAWEHCQYWQNQDKKTMKKINYEDSQNYKVLHVFIGKMIQQ